MATQNPSQQPAGAGTHTGEGFGFMDLAKSKVILFLAKSCELVLLLGTIWMTVTLTTPAAASMLGGWPNTIIITLMGVAVDAAMPESFIHAVAQRLEQKTTQFKWSITIAICMLLLVVINFVNSAVESRTGTSLPGGVIVALIIIRGIVGLSYVTIRECQMYIDRQTANQRQVIPVVDVVERLATFTETMNRRFSEMKSESERRLQMTETRLSEMLTRVVSESEARFTETLRTFTETPDTTFSESLSESLTESLQGVICSQVQAELQPVYDALQAHASILEALAGLPSQQAQLSVIVREVKATVERIPSFSESQASFSERPKLLSLKAKSVPAVKAEESFTEASLKETSESGFDKKAFVLTCLTENSAMTISEIQRRAEAAGQSVSTGYISNIRKALGEEQSA